MSGSGRPRGHARAATGAWAGYAASGTLLGLVALAAWGRALALRGPVLYGEGAVAHAAALLSALATYREGPAGTFTAANYPPLGYAIAAVGDPFLSGRLASIAATLSVAGLIAWRARAAGRLVALALAAGWVAVAPVSVWGAALKPDLVALALTAGAVLALESRRARLAGALLVAAVLAKPTAALTALALLGWLLWRDRALVRPFLASLTVGAALAVLGLAPFGYADLVRHVVSWNALPWSAGSAALLAFLGVVVLAAPLTVLALRGAPHGPLAAYTAAALGVVVLGGREGATINYLLDLSAALGLVLAARAPLLARAPWYPLGASLALVVGLVLLDPLGVVPGRTATTGAWGDPARQDAVRTALAADRLILAEDSGLLVATGHAVRVDDLFLWSRLSAAGAIDPGPVLADVRAGRYDAIVSEVELARLDGAPAYERARWEPRLVAAIVERYRPAERLAGGLFVYRPR